MVYAEARISFQQVANSLGVLPDSWRDSWAWSHSDLLVSCERQLEQGRNSVSLDIYRNCVSDRLLAFWASKAKYFENPQSSHVSYQDNGDLWIKLGDGDYCMFYEELEGPIDVKVLTIMRKKGSSSDIFSIRRRMDDNSLEDSEYSVEINSVVDDEELGLDKRYKIGFRKGRIAVFECKEYFSGSKSSAVEKQTKYNFQ